MLAVLRSLYVETRTASLRRSWRMLNVSNVSGLVRHVPYLSPRGHLDGESDPALVDGLFFAEALFLAHQTPQGTGCWRVLKGFLGYKQLEVKKRIGSN
jgi:hypothetical protein